MFKGAGRNLIQYSYTKLITKKPNKHADPINYKADARTIKPYNQSATNIWTLKTKCILKAISVHPTEAIKGTMRFPLHIGHFRKAWINPANSVEADVYAIDPPCDGKEDPRQWFAQISRHRSYMARLLRGNSLRCLCTSQDSSNSRIFMPNWWPVKPSF